MATFDITGHAMLSAEAKNLESESPTVFDAHVIAAEMLHDLYGSSYSGDDLEIVRLLLVYQVNYQLENDADSELYSRIVEGERDYQFKANAPPTSDTARALRAKLDEQSTTPGSSEQKKYPNSTPKRNVGLW